MKGPGRRNFSDSKPKISIAGNSLTFCTEGARTDKKRKATALTVDNADDVFAECFDLDTFIKLLDRTFDVSHNPDVIYSFMKASVVDSKVSTTPSFTPYLLHMPSRQVVPFTSASKRHLNLLGINVIGDLEIDPDRVRALDLPDSLPNTILRQDVVAGFKKHFSLSVSKSSSAFVK